MRRWLLFLIIFLFMIPVVRASILDDIYNGLLGLLGINNNPEPIIETQKQNPQGGIYTPSSETHCSDGICTLTLYSGVRYVYENKEWIKLEDSTISLKEYFNVILLNENPNLEIIVKDFTYRAIDFEVKAKDSRIVGKNIPVKVSGVERTSIKFNKLGNVESARIEFPKGDSVLFHNYTFGVRGVISEI